ncbi:MAG: DNA/RNA non-specific endonuclease [Alphaproteobacteria bacterium]|nr:MAG: DNA/RNA non-specific endonuclease [Alphaproteobacteria bacterium]
MRVAIIALSLTLITTAPSAVERHPATGEVDCALPAHRAVPRVAEGDPRSLAVFHNPGLVMRRNGAPLTRTTDRQGDDYLACFDGYLSWFDRADGDVAGAGSTRLAVPHSVVHFVPPRDQSAAGETQARPTRWLSLVRQPLVGPDLSPTHDSYRSTTANPTTRWERGHLAQKALVERISPDAGRFSHSVANAVPQVGLFNRTAWLDLECRTGAWANRFGGVWVITGPVFSAAGLPATLATGRGRGPAVAVPDHLFKLVVRQANHGAGWQVLAFILPQHHTSYADRSWVLEQFRVSLNEVRWQVPATLLPTIAWNDPVASDRDSPLWDVERAEFDPACRRFAPTAPTSRRSR